MIWKERNNGKLFLQINTKISRICTEGDGHLLEDGQEDVCRCRVGHNLGDGGREEADNQVDQPDREPAQVDEVLHQPR